MDPEHLNSLLIILFAISLSAFFSGMEIAFISANRLKIELDKNRGVISGKILARFNKKPSEFIAAMLLGNNIALVVYGIYTAIVLEPSISRYISSNDAVILTIQTILSTILILFTGEFMPKSLFRINPNKILSFFSLPVLVFFWIMYPITFFVMFLSNTILKAFGTDTSNSEVAFTKNDLGDFVEDINQNSSSEDDEVDNMDNELEFLRNALEFSNLRARDCMIPRTEIEAIELEDSIENLKEKFVKTGFSKIPVYRENIDHIIGYVHSFELFKKPEQIKQILLPIVIAPKTILAKELLEKLIAERKSIALVVDEFGGTSGLVTIEDIIEEIFGEIEDEHDQEELVEKIVENNKLLLSGRHEVSYLNEKYELDIPESEGYETLAGFILEETEEIPPKNKVYRWKNFSIKVLEVTQSKIDLVEFRKERE